MWIITGNKGPIWLSLLHSCHSSDIWQDVCWDRHQSLVRLDCLNNVSEDKGCILHLRHSTDHSHESWLVGVVLMLTNERSGVVARRQKFAGVTEWQFPELVRVDGVTVLTVPRWQWRHPDMFSFSSHTNTSQYQSDWQPGNNNQYNQQHQQPHQHQHQHQHQQKLRYTEALHMSPGWSKKERRRTENLNSAYNNLRDCLPNVPSDTKLTKIKTLKLATSYIDYLINILQSKDCSHEEFRPRLFVTTGRKCKKKPRAGNNAEILASCYDGTVKISA